MMKFLSLLFSSFLVNPAAGFASDTLMVERTEQKALAIDSKVDILSKNLNQNDIRKDDGLWLFENEAPTQMLMNKEQSAFISDMNNQITDIRINYVAKFNTSKIRTEMRATQNYSYLMEPIGKTKVKQSDKEVEIGSRDNRILFNSKDNKTAIQVRPYMKLNPLKFENDVYKKELGFYYLGIEGITINFRYKVFNLAAIKMRPILIRYEDTEINQEEIKKQIKKELDRTIKDIYKLPYRVIDVEQTIKNIDLEMLNHERTNRFYIQLVTFKNIHVEGTIVQEINYEHERNNLFAISKVNELRSSTIHEVLYDHYINREDLKLTINLSDKKITLENSTSRSVKYFINDGPLEKLLDYQNIRIIKNGELAAELYNGGWNIFNEDDTENLLFNYLSNDEQNNSEDKLEQDEETNSNDSNEEDGTPANETNANKKTNLKYLWLLAIPFGLGIFCLITWLIPLLKRKK